jgi:hypothetical protein
VHAGVCALGVMASIVSVDHQVAAVILLAIALVVLAADLAGWSPVRRLMPARATQNVVANSPRQAPVHVIVTASIDAPRMALLGYGALGRAEARARRDLRGHLPGPHGIVVAALVALAVLTAVRADSGGSTAVGLLQIVPTTLLLLGAAGFAETAVADAAPGANAHASAAAVALSLVERLDAAPPDVLAVDLVLVGAGEPEALGLRHEVRARRRAGTRPVDVVVLHIAPCGGGTPAWWTREGRLLALPYHPGLVELCGLVARDPPHLGAQPHETRGVSPARVARASRWPSIAVGCIDADRVAPRAGEETDVAEAVDRAAMDAALEFCLALVRRLDAQLAARGPTHA